MNNGILKQINVALSHLNPNEVRESAQRPLSVLLVAASSAGYADLEDFLAPAGISRARRLEVFRTLYRETDALPHQGFDLALYERGVPYPEGFRPNRTAFVFDADDPGETVRQILDRREELRLALAREFPPFRKEVTRRIISAISRENAIFALATALPDLVPTAFSFPWAIGEFASDTTVLTANQVRMAFLLGGSSNREIGYLKQKSEIASIIAGAFGWRAIARELAGKIPLGAGLVPKAAIAFAGTYAVGASLERLYRLGYGYTKKERKLLYEDGFQRGKELVESILHGRRGAGSHSPLG
jgi:hypothetical protein